MKNFLFITTIALVFSVSDANSAPFDGSGLIDLKNQATIRASCSMLGMRMEIATNQLGMAIRQRPFKNQDEMWMNFKKSDEIFAFGKRAGYKGKRLGDNIMNEIPPSQVQDYFVAINGYLGRHGSADRDPQRMLRGWNYCLSRF